MKKWEKKEIEQYGKEKLQRVLFMTNGKSKIIDDKAKIERRNWVL